MQITVSYSESFIKKEELEVYIDKVNHVHNQLHSKEHYDKMPLGWIDLPIKKNFEEIERIEKAADRLRDCSQAFISIGIGGSYLGSRAAIEMFPSDSPEIYFAGNNISGTYLKSIVDSIKDKDFSICVISKSGTTLETALAFRVFREILEKKYGKSEAKNRIIAVTDGRKGTLLEIAKKEGYEIFEIPMNIGGRYSVLTPAALVTMAVAGIDIKKVLKGAEEAYHAYNNPNIYQNDCYKYSVLRNILYKKGKIIETLVNYEPFMEYFGKWWQQLFGESEGKEGKGIFPAVLQFSTDLHSMGQYLQEGTKNVFETIIKINNPADDVTIPYIEDDSDGLNYLADKTFNHINKVAYEGAMKAHEEGGTPTISIEIPFIDEHSFGHLVYFMKKACAASGYLLGINPFDQPGVELYKKNIYRLLNR
ncbi:MAG: glucose-6-phosphate isomerase [Clostridiales bacterium]|nr:glucose-6-phosphate isomerase [Clostridiales bacterium]